MPANPSLSRRTMLQASGFGVLALTLPLPTVGTAAAAGYANTPPVLRRASWAALAGHDVQVVGGPVLQLTAVSDLARAASDASLRDLDEAFVLSFSGPANRPLDSEIHQLAHPELGTVSLFVTPVGQVGSSQQYEAVVDRTVRIPGMLDAPAVTGTAADAVAEAEASTLGVVAPAVGAAPASVLRKRLKVRAQAHRTASRTKLDLDLTGAAVQAVAVRVVRHGKTLASGQGLVQHGKASLVLHGRHRLARGTYDLVVTATDRKAQALTVTRTVKIR